MYKRYYIADCHFFHKNLLDQMDNRGFESVEAMNEYMISQWNSKVEAHDDVVILGDFSVGKPEETMEILSRLKGNKYLIRGNHDRFLDSGRFDKTLFKCIEDYKELKDDGRRVVLSHYPMIFYNGQFLKNKKGDGYKTYMLYGHVHASFDEVLLNRFVDVVKTEERQVASRITEDAGEIKMTITPCQMINCFCKFSDYVPLTLDEWIELDKKRRDEI